MSFRRRSFRVVGRENSMGKSSGAKRLRVRRGVPGEPACAGSARCISGVDRGSFHGLEALQETLDPPPNFLALRLVPGRFYEELARVGDLAFQAVALGRELDDRGLEARVLEREVPIARRQPFQLFHEEA